MIDSLEIMKSCFFDKIVFFIALNCIKMWYFQSKNIQCWGFKDKFILVLNTCLVCVKECKKFSAWRFWILFLIILLLSIFLAFLFFLIFLFELVCLWAFDLYTKISNFFLIPIERYRNMVFSKIVICKWIRICIIDMEAVIYCWTCTSSIVRDYAYLLPVCIYSTASDISNQRFSIFKSTGLTDLFYFIRNGKYSDVGLLCPANKEIICNLNSTYFAFTFRKHQRLLDLPH